MSNRIVIYTIFILIPPTCFVINVENTVLNENNSIAPEASPSGALPVCYYRIPPTMQRPTRAYAVMNKQVMLPPVYVPPLSVCSNLHHNVFDCFTIDIIRPVNY